MIYPKDTTGSARHEQRFAEIGKIKETNASVCVTIEEGFLNGINRLRKNRRYHFE
jgi:hypothetical protein